MPVFSSSVLETLCNDRSLVNVDDDDKLAIILTMKTVKFDWIIKFDGNKTKD